MKRRHNLCAAVFLSLLAAACTNDEATNRPAASATVQVRLQTAAPDGEFPLGEADSESEIRTVTAYRFEQGLLREVIEGRPAAGEGCYTFSSAELRGELHLAVNAAGIGALTALTPGESTLGELLACEASLAEMTADGLTMTGSLTLGAQTSAVVPVTLRRSMARIDLLSRDAGVEVHEVTIRDVADRGMIWSAVVVQTPASASREAFTRNYGEAPLRAARERLLYLCEQQGGELEVEVVARFDEGWHRLRSRLPATIARNTVYTLEVFGRGADASVTVTAGSWDEGTGAESQPVVRGLVDLDASTLPDDVRVNAACDTLFIPHTPSELRVVLRGEAGSEMTVDGVVSGVSVTPQRLTRGLEQVAAVEVRSPLRVPGTKNGYIALNLSHEGVSTGRVVLLFEANPVRVEGLLTLDDEGLCDFDRYLEGELARITLPEGMRIGLEFPADESRWMDLVRDGDSWRLLGGWKPNDPKADGRPQEGYLVVTDAAGGHPERYTVRRRNWGLPVVKIGGEWWCKYNLRGDVKRFEDQVPVSADPAGDRALADHLATCDDGELLALLGDQYQANNPVGLPLRHNGTAFYHEGMVSTTQNFGTLDRETMAPYGYRLPDYDAYAFFALNENHNIGGVGERTYRNAAGDEITVRIQERTAGFLGHAYGTIAIYEFRSGDSTWVLASLGHQWNTTPGNISPMMLLLATWGNSSKTWVMEGYAAADRPGQNWLKFMAQNTTKTRTVRCVKSPVEYIYD